MSLFTLALALFAFADFEPNKEQKAILDGIIKELPNIDEELPPCEAHDRLSELVLSRKVPAACPKVSAFYEHLHKRDRLIRDKCRETTGWLEQEFRSAPSCGENGIPIQQAKLKRLLKLKKDSQGAEDVEENDPSDDLGPEDKPEGEMKRSECAFAAMLLMQFRKQQWSLAAKHFGSADYALDSECDNRKAVEEYLRYIREGDKGR